MIHTAGMSNVLDEEKKQQVLALGRLGWSLRRIEGTTGVRRETASGYLKAAGVPSAAGTAEGVAGSTGQHGAGVHRVCLVGGGQHERSVRRLDPVKTGHHERGVHRP